MNVNKDLLINALKKLGYIEFPSVSKLISQWQRPEDRLGSSSVFVPNDSSKTDYHSLLGRSYDQLAQLYGPVFTVLYEQEQYIEDNSLDPISIHSETSVESGFIPWDTGYQLFDALRGILEAGARTAYNKKRNLRNSGNVIASSVLQDSLMGQTQVGSYIVTALVPKNKPFAASSSKNPSETAKTILGKVITSTISDSIKAVQYGIEEVGENIDDDRRFEVFDSLVTEGVSYELIKALTNLDTGLDSEVSVILTGNAQDAQEKTLLHIEPPAMKVLTKASVHLSKPKEPESKYLTGEVVQLNHSEYLPQRQIKLRTIVDGKIRTVSIHLNREQYEIAIDAHRRERQLLVHGTVEFHQRGSVLDNPKEVRITPFSIRNHEKKTVPAAEELPLIDDSNVPEIAANSTRSNN